MITSVNPRNNQHDGLDLHRQSSETGCMDAACFEQLQQKSACLCLCNLAESSATSTLFWIVTDSKELSNVK